MNAEPAAKSASTPKTGILCLCALALAATFLLTATSASAAEPTLTVDPVSAHAITTAHVSGTVTFDSEANGGSEGLWTFQYCEDGAPGECTESSPWSYGPEPYAHPALPPGTTAEAVEEVLPGLKAATEYSVRLAAYPFATGVEVPSPEGTYQSFTTDPAPVAPVLELQAPTPSYLSAQIQGTLDPEGGNLNGPGEPVPIHWAIELSESGEPETFFEVASGDIAGPEAEESNPITVPAVPAEPGLTQNTTYHYRLRATYAGQQAITTDATFTTKEVQKPQLTIADASEVFYQRAHFSGTVKLATNDPAFDTSSCVFEYATAEDFSGAAQVACEPQTILASEAQPVSVSADLTGLAPATTYHLRIAAENPGGREAETAPDTFTTLPVAKPTIVNLQVSAITPHTATFSAEVDPNAPKAKAETDEAEQEAFLTHYHFQCQPECPALEGEVLAGKDPEGVSKEATGLTPGVHYAVSLFASNAGGEEPPAGPVSFTTEALPPQINATFAASVAETEATLKAKVNPGGAETTVHFDYTTTDFSSCTPTGPDCFTTPESTSIGSDVEDHTASAEIAGLTPNTAYRYRVVATNTSPGDPVITGPAKALHTASPAPVFSDCPTEALRRENNSTALPDCRAYEMVSPLDKNGSSAYPETAPLAQTSPDGEKLAYVSFSAFPGAQGSTIGTAHVSSRTAGGWQSAEWTPPTPSSAPFSFPFFVSYDFSEDLTQVVTKMPLIALVPGATPYAYNLFLRHPSGEYSLVNAALPEVPVEAMCLPKNLDKCWQSLDVPAFAGASTDFDHILFESNAQLLPQAPPTGTESLYESSGGKVNLVGFLPDGNPAANSTAGARSSAEYSGGESEDLRVEHAISADGSRVIFSAPSDGGEENEAGQAGMIEVYDRIGGNETIEISAPSPGAAPVNPAPGPATFWAASVDGAKVFFTSPAELTTASNTGPANEHEDLYEYDFEKAPSQRLTDLTVDADPGGARLLGVVDAADDGSSIYFVAEGQLDGAKGTNGQPNLYMSHKGGAPVFIATLGTGACGNREERLDACDWTPFPVKLQAYVTPDAQHMAFMSTESLPTVNFPEGYDNTDRKTGNPDSQVYLYSAPSATEEGQLLCGSCDPSGARPSGNALIGGVSLGLRGEQTRGGIGTPFNRPAALSEDGARLFYTAPDKNGFHRVFEYQRGGEGSCEEADGCQYQISPSSEKSDKFLGSAHGGRDVFFATAPRLVPGDEDNLVDVYDAREGGGFAVPPLPPICEKEACRGPATSPLPAHTTTTGRFTGPEEGPKHPRCAKGQVKRQGRCANRKRHARKHHKRANHNGRGNK